MESSRNNPSGTVPDDTLLDAAYEAIVAVGWKRTTLTDVARRAGVSRMTLYRRWPDMNTLLADLLTREWLAEVTRLSPPEAQASGDSRSNGVGPSALLIARTVCATVATLRTNPLLRKIIDVDPELLLPYLLHRRGRSQDAVLALLTPAVEQGQREGSVRPGDPAVLARSVVLASYGFAFSAHTMADAPADPDDEAVLATYDAELMRLIESYLRP